MAAGRSVGPIHIHYVFFWNGTQSVPILHYWLAHLLAFQNCHSNSQKIPFNASLFPSPQVSPQPFSDLRLRLKCQRDTWDSHPRKSTAGQLKSSISQHKNRGQGYSLGIVSLPFPSLYVWRFQTCVSEKSCSLASEMDLKLNGGIVQPMMAPKMWWNGRLHVRLQHLCSDFASHSTTGCSRQPAFSLNKKEKK